MLNTVLHDSLCCYSYCCHVLCFVCLLFMIFPLIKVLYWAVYNFAKGRGEGGANLGYGKKRGGGADNSIV